MTNNQREWIDNATYDELLHKWRFTTTSEAIFNGAYGEYFAAVMAERRKGMTTQEKVFASKRVGWEP